LNMIFQKTFEALFAWKMSAKYLVTPCLMAEVCMKGTDFMSRSAE